MKSPVRLPQIPIEQIQVGKDLFLCRPYTAVIAAEVCALRQASARERGKGTEFLKCLGCPYGSEVEKRLGGQVVLRPPEERAFRGAVGVEELRARIVQLPPGMQPGFVPPPLPPLEPKRMSKPKTQPPKPKVDDAERCTAPGCTAARAKAPSKVPGGETYCGPHRRGIAASLEKVPPKEARSEVPSGVTPLHVLPPPWIGQPLTRLGEAFELVEAIGWDTVRGLAETIRKARGVTA